MQPLCLKGMWRCALNKKLKKRIKDISLLKFCMKLDESMEGETYCATYGINQDCPFFLSSKQQNQSGICLSPRHAKEWHEEYEGKKFISPTYKNASYRVVGCYILPFCEHGYATYLRLLSWRHKVEQSWPFQVGV